MPVATRTPISIDYAKYYSLESKNRQRSRLKEIKPFSEMPGMINVSVQPILCAKKAQD
jgi:aromatic amino acid aminotransferase I